MTLPSRIETTFSYISFRSSRFEEIAVFDGRTFERPANFTLAHFFSPPSFEASTSLARIDFTGAKVGFAPPGKLLHWTTDSRILIRLRALRKVAEETKNHDLERDLYIEERKAERGVHLDRLLGALDQGPVLFRKTLEDIERQQQTTTSKWRNKALAALGELATSSIAIGRLAAQIGWIFVMWGYWALADYGRSVVRPVAWLIASYFFFSSRYLATLTQGNPTDLEKYKNAIRMLALGNAVPFVGPLTIDAELEKYLFCPAGTCSPPVIPPEGHQLLVVGQNLFSIICVFFIGLALRNYFKIK